MKRAWMWLVCWLALGVVIAGAWRAMAASASPASSTNAAAVQATSHGEPIPAHVPRFGRARPVIAVIAHNDFTELTDYVVPFGVLSESGVAEVHALAMQEGPVRMFPALRVQPQATAAAFDTRYPQGADYVIVPAVHHTQDPALIAWVRAQANKGATIVGVCDGVWVVGHAGLLSGKKAVGHWYAFDDLIKTFPDTRFLKNTRYVADGQVITTTGVTASIPVSLAIVAAIAGRQEADLLAARLGVDDWGTAHRSEDFQLHARHIVTAAWNGAAFWRHEDIEIPLKAGGSDIALALVADAYSRTYRSSAYARSATAAPVLTRHGLAIYPDRHGDQAVSERSVRLMDDVPQARALDVALKGIAERYGPATAGFVALQLEYPWPVAP